MAMLLKQLHKRLLLLAAITSVLVAPAAATSTPDC
jgi:hypothetical protein